MAKEFMLKYLKKEHLRGNKELFEIAELSGLDVVKQLFRNHEGLRMCYIPVLANNKEVIREVIRSNKDKHTISQLVNITGLSRRKIEKIIAEQEMKD